MTIAEFSNFTSIPAYYMRPKPQRVLSFCWSSTGNLVYGKCINHGSNQIEGYIDEFDGDLINN